ncbi:hypothetical protein [Pseudomonas putida]|uniref:Uncharacterized protein n=1 Tax=Pseudomonas putida TaxID=303 RepID=A0A8I1ECI0_PSEPU|nr:hypothetical protein [Pseudomonas putida]MBI6882769.1 hypothetical protein [Pseudomonas putida]
MYDPDTAKAADIEMILSMADMLVCGEEEAKAGLNQYQEQWANQELDLQGLKSYMTRLCHEQLIACDMLSDFIQLVDQSLSRDYSIDPESADEKNGVAPIGVDTTFEDVGYVAGFSASPAT